MRIGRVVRILEVWPEPVSPSGPGALEDVRSEPRVVVIAEPAPAAG